MINIPSSHQEDPIKDKVLSLIYGVGAMELGIDESVLSKLDKNLMIAIKDIQKLGVNFYPNATLNKKKFFK